MSHKPSKSLGQVLHVGNHENHAYSTRHDFLKAKTWDEKHEAYKELSKSRHRPDLLMVARAAFELAATAVGQNAQTDFLVESTERAKIAQDNPLNSISKQIDSDRFAANLPILTVLHIDDEHPGIELLEKAHRLAAAGLRPFIKKRLTDMEDPRDFIGSAAESVALILLQRYATEKIGCSGWTPVPALLTEDCPPGKWAGSPHSWDISIYAEEPIEIPTYKVQVKYSSFNQEYAPDIAVVNLRTGIRNEYEREYTSLQTLMAVACSHIEERPDPFVARQVDFRTDRILDLIEQTA